MDRTFNISPFPVTMNWDDIGLDIVRWCINSFVQACPQYANIADLQAIESKNVTTSFRIKDSDGKKIVQCTTILECTNTILVIHYDVPQVGNKLFDFDICAQCHMVHGGEDDVFGVRFSTKVDVMTTNQADTTCRTLREMFPVSQV